jgi:hypothetical protein
MREEKESIKDRNKCNFQYEMKQFKGGEKHVYPA